MKYTFKMCMLKKPLIKRLLNQHKILQEVIINKVYASEKNF